MGSYVIMFPADSESEWAARSPAEQQAVFDTDVEFGQRLEASGGAVTGGAGLTRSEHAHTLTPGQDGGAVVSSGTSQAGDGQLSGFFLVTCEDHDAVVRAAEVLVRAHPVVEIRPVAEF